MTYKVCSCCGKNKKESEYYLTGKFTKSGRNIPRAKCKKCVQGGKQKRRENIRETHATFNIKALEFHHPQDNKEFNIADAAGRGMAIENLMKEIDKCVLLCARCHIEIHSK